MTVYLLTISQVVIIEPGKSCVKLKCYLWGTTLLFSAFDFMCGYVLEAEGREIPGLSLITSSISSVLRGLEAV